MTGEGPRRYLGPESRVRRAEGVLSRRVAGQEIVVVVPSLVTCTLDQVGTETWSLLDGRTLESVAEALGTVFGLAPAGLLPDVLRFAGELADAGAITVMADPPASG